MRKIKIFTGQDIDRNKLNTELIRMHPVEAVQYAMKVANGEVLVDDFYTNDADFIMAIKYFSELFDDVEVEFFLNGVSNGSALAKSMKDINRAIYMIGDLYEKTINEKKWK